MATPIKPPRKQLSPAARKAKAAILRKQAEARGIEREKARKEKP